MLFLVCRMLDGMELIQPFFRLLRAEIGKDIF